MIGRVAIALCIATLAGAAAAAPLGRLFFTPEQRAALDKSRKPGDRAAAESEFKPPPGPHPPQNVSVSGLIRRSDGKHSIWLNNRLVDERKTGGLDVGMGRRENQVRVKVPEGGRSVELKVGQTLEVVSGTVEENFARRAAATPAAGAAAPAENSAPEASAVTPPATREPVRLESLSQKRPARAAEDEPNEDVRPARRIQLK